MTNKTTITKTAINPTELVYLGFEYTTEDGYPLLVYSWRTSTGAPIKVYILNKSDFGCEISLVLSDEEKYFIGEDGSGAVYKNVGAWNDPEAKAAFAKWGPILEETAGEVIFPGKVVRWAEKQSSLDNMTEEETIKNSTTIKLYPGMSIEPVMITIQVPDDRDTEEYIDEYLDGLLSDFVRYNCEWEFA